MGIKSSEVLRQSTRDSVRARALLIAAYSVYHLPVDGLQKFKLQTKIDFKQSVQDQITEIVLNKTS